MKRSETIWHLVLPAGISLNLVMLLNNLIIENYGFALINVVSAFILTAILEKQEDKKND